MLASCFTGTLLLRLAAITHCTAPCCTIAAVQNGFEIYIEVHRVSLYYVITAILPIYINTCLALLVSKGLALGWLQACIPCLAVLLP